ncbi:hypothetical protein BYT27DRAFT_7185038 [Phlegmacium glaucopus]|nr:hypothetical protein BYT27DRAFT_7185038 [Phlegmacium glaucopus]
MALYKQTARKSTGGKAPRKQLSVNPARKTAQVCLLVAVAVAETTGGNDTPPHPRHSRNPSGATKLNERNLVPQTVIPLGDGSRSTTHKGSLALPSGINEPHSASGSKNSTFSSTLYTKEMGVDHQTLDGRQSPVSEPPPLQSPSSSSQNDELLNPHQYLNIRTNSSPLLPEVRRQQPNTLIPSRVLGFRRYK